ncbi:unnamed protein product [Cyprideis torosa]|uniref:Uncharacterized protein n=1 Tax=Cyprideis torosa TaxID=163714 RepID=A0A7R8WNQ7_9CRUS|nr:unnamed protein product [Cyprideis torosa]CAG0906431.1 unnamed protein product [Cyprideis torosa]
MSRIEVDLGTVLDSNNHLNGPGGRRLRLRGLTRLSPEGVGQSQKILQAKDQRDSSLKSPSSANHSHGSLAFPAYSFSPKEKGASRQDR